MQEIEFLIPGAIDALTGGYRYDAHIAKSLGARGIEVHVRALDADLGQPDAHAQALATIASLPDGALTVFDGLALAPLAQAIETAAKRLHTVALVHHPAALETGLPSARARDIAQQERRALKAVELIVCTSRWTARELARTDLAGPAIHVVEPGIDPEFLESLQPDARRDPARAHAEGLRMLCVATVTPRKGHDVLIDALSELADLDWQLECIGSLERDREYAAGIEARVARHRLHSRVHFRGDLDRRRLAREFSRADLFVLASRLEGYGMVFDEAAAAALPVVATRGGAIEDTLSKASAIVVDGSSHRELAAQLRTLMTDRAAWLQMSEQAGRCARNVRTWQQAAEEFAAAVSPSGHR